MRYNPWISVTKKYLSTGFSNEKKISCLSLFIFWRCFCSFSKE